MVDPVKKSLKKPISKESAEEEYELLPHKDIVELREELRKLKSLPSEAGRHAEVSYEDLTKKMDRLIEIFEEAEKTIKIEEGAATFKEKMTPIVDKMNEILRQNSEIAEGIVALADIMNEMKEKLEVGVIYKAKEAERIKTEPIPAPRFGPAAPPAGPPRPPVPGAPPPPPGMLPPRLPMPPPGAPGPVPPLPRFGAPMPPPPGAAPMPGPMPPPPGGMPPPPKKKKGLFGR